jgi:hypothetical protein
VEQPEWTRQGYGHEASCDNREAFLGNKEALYDNRYHPRA